MSKLTVKFVTTKGAKSAEALGKDAKGFFEKSDMYLLNGAVICTHLNGITIPSYTEVIKTKDKEGNEVEETIEHEEIKGYTDSKNKKGLSYSKIGDMVGKSKATVNNYVNAIVVAISNGLFEALVNGEINFNVQKMRTIDAHKDILIDNLHTFEDLMAYSEDSIEAMIKEKEGTTTSTTTTEGNEGEDEDTTTDETTEELIFEVNGKMYSKMITKAEAEALIEGATEVVNEE